MFGIKIKNKFLKLYPNTDLSFELASPAYLGDKVDVIGNSFVFSVKIPLDGENPQLLKYPHVVENDWRFLKNEPCEIFKNGRCIFMGALTVTKATPPYVRVLEAEISIVVNTISQLKDLKMNELDCGTIPSTGVLERAKQTVLHPLDYPYIFYPVYNPTFSEAKQVQNLWDGEKFVLQYINRIGDTHRREAMMTPHLRIDFILEKMFAHVGFTLRSYWQDSDELKLLTQVGFGGMHGIFNEFPSAPFKLNRALSSTTAATWLGKICRTFSLVPVVDLFDKTVDLMPFSMLLTRPAKHDWTRNLLREGSISENYNYPKSLTFKKISGKFSPDNVSQLPISSVALLPDADDGLYRDGNAYVYHRKHELDGNISMHDVIVQRDNVANIEGGLEAIEIDLAGLPQIEAFQTYFYLPVVEQAGKLPDEERDTPDYLLFYRGMYTQLAVHFPFATSETDCFITTTVLNQRPPQYDLTWTGENGIFNRFWQSNFQFLKEKRDVTVKLALTLDVLMQFNFADKIRIGNMEYLVKNIRGTLRASGENVLVEVDLVTVV